MVAAGSSGALLEAGAGGWWYMLQNEAVTMGMCPGCGCGGEEVPAARL